MFAYAMQDNSFTFLRSLLCFFQSWAVSKYASGLARCRYPNLTHVRLLDQERDPIERARQLILRLDLATDDELQVTQGFRQTFLVLRRALADALFIAR
jgi:hypothetical protein